MDQGGFDNISWQNDPESESPRAGPPTTGSEPSAVQRQEANGKRKSSSSEVQAGHQADALDLAGVGDGTLICTVGSPQKENDGTKDAFMSYLVTTQVRSLVILAESHTVLLIVK
jgi:sorting nexin-4